MPLIAKVFPARDTSAARTVVLTRSADRNATLAAQLRARGRVVVELPCTQTVPLADEGPLGRALRSLTASDLLIVTSRAGAEAVLRSLERPLAARAATVGRQAASALEAGGVTIDLVAQTGAELGRVVALPPGAVLLARSDRALRDLPEILAARGATVREVVAYRTVNGLPADAGSARSLLNAGATVILASPSAVDALLDALGPDALAAARLIATGPTTAAHVRARTGRDATVVPAERVPEAVS